MVRDFGFLPSRFTSRLPPFQTSYRQFACRIVWLFLVLPAVLWDAKPILAPRKHSDIDNRVVSKPIWNVIPLTVACHSSNIIRTQTNANRTNRRIELRSLQAREDEKKKEGRRKGLKSPENALVFRSLLGTWWHIEPKTVYLKYTIGENSLFSSQAFCRLSRQAGLPVCHENYFGGAKYPDRHSSSGGLPYRRWNYFSAVELRPFLYR